MALNAAISLTATGNIVAAVSGKRIRVLALHVQRDETDADTVTVACHDGASTTTNLSGALPKSFVLPFNPEGWFDTLVGEALRLVLSGTVTVTGNVTYTTIG